MKLFARATNRRRLAANSQVYLGVRRCPDYALHTNISLSCCLLYLYLYSTLLVLSAAAAASTVL